MEVREGGVLKVLKVQKVKSPVTQVVKNEHLRGKKKKIGLQWGIGSEWKKRKNRTIGVGGGSRGG